MWSGAKSGGAGAVRRASVDGRRRDGHGTSGSFGRTSQRRTIHVAPASSAAEREDRRARSEGSMRARIAQAGDAADRRTPSRPACPAECRWRVPMMKCSGRMRMAPATMFTTANGASGHEAHGRHREHAATTHHLAQTIQPPARDASHALPVEPHPERIGRYRGDEDADERIREAVPRAERRDREQRDAAAAGTDDARGRVRQHHQHRRPSDAARSPAPTR